MNIESITTDPLFPNQYRAIVDGVPMVIGTKPGQDPADVLRSLQDQPEPSYREKRLQDYPTVAEQLDMIYHDLDGWRERIAAIKARHPKS